MAEVRMLFQRYGGADADRLANWIHTRQVIAFEWRHETWLPMFQFSRKTMAVHPALKPVLRELSPIYDGWETANWFALRNTWLAARAPVEMLTRDLSAVWYAARVDRFIALGEVGWDRQAWDSASSDSTSGVTDLATNQEICTERRHRGRSGATHH